MELRELARTPRRRSVGLVLIGLIVVGLVALGLTARGSSPKVYSVGNGADGPDGVATGSPSAIEGSTTPDATASPSATDPGSPAPSAFSDEASPSTTPATVPATQSGGNGSGSRPTLYPVTPGRPVTSPAHPVGPAATTPARTPSTAAAGPATTPAHTVTTTPPAPATRPATTPATTPAAPATSTPGTSSPSTVKPVATTQPPVTSSAPAPTTAPAPPTTAPTTAPATTSALGVTFGSHVALTVPLNPSLPISTLGSQAWWLTGVYAWSSSSTRAGASWTVRPGLRDAGCVSFESVAQPGSYLRHANFVLWVNRRDGSSLFDADATWCPTRARNGGSGVSLRSWNYPSLYLTRALGGSLQLVAPNWFNAGDQSFAVRAGFA